MLFMELGKMKKRKRIIDPIKYYFNVDLMSTKNNYSIDKIISEVEIGQFDWKERFNSSYVKKYARMYKWDYLALQNIIKIVNKKRFI